MAPVIVNPYRFGAAPAASTYSTEVAADSPLIYLRMDDTSGTTAIDSSGNGHSGTYTNSPTLNATSLLSDGSGHSVSYDGTNDYIRVVWGSWMNVSNFTTDAIIQPTSGSLSGTRIIGGRWENTNNFQHFIYIASGKLKGSAWIAGAQKDVGGTTSLTAGVTYHVALKYDGSALKLYLNGSVDSTLTVSGSLQQPASAGIEVGRGALSNTTAYAGLIDEYAYYGTALSDARIAAHYAAI